jgi:proteic killer suppression protein
VIRSFRNRALKRYFEEGDRSKLNVVNLRRLDTILSTLDEAARPDEMSVPGWRFHALKGSMRGRYAVNASGNWRLTFGWDGEDAIEVDLEDYH